MLRIEVRPLEPLSIAPAARLLAQSMCDNPLHRRVFGICNKQVEPLLEGAFVRVLQARMDTGLVLGAYRDEALAGVVAMAAPGYCRVGLRDGAAMLAMLVRGRALHRLPHILRWLWVWARNEPSRAHWHLGPAAVVREFQGQGIGGRLMAAICDELDCRQGIGYLETDKDANVRLYHRGGFRVVAELRVLGVNNWFMVRQPASMEQESVLNVT